ncbi:hypothetical protein Dxin01_00812 [Deinococcus xinjiangensis]|uniref:THIF-type NAD/FAD binding fold domain-containing protein n=1 Tax=Deinococcus xinjiangensis TaxID=457454 RepID=A0ABP9V8Y0_9DEIO
MKIRRYLRPLKRPLSVAVIGCGGTGSHILSGLTHLHHAVIALGGQGLDVHVFDPDKVEAHNVVRQRFYPGDLGEFKNVALISRINRAHGLHWRAFPQTFAQAFTSDNQTYPYDVVIGCVDSRAARAEIRSMVTLGAARRTRFWLDIGNARFPDGRFGGQILFGEPRNDRNWRSRKAGRLPVASELYPELCSAHVPEDTQPSCSALESLKRQDLFLNGLLAQHALNLLWRVIVEHKLDVNAIYLDATGHHVNAEFVQLAEAAD